MRTPSVLIFASILLASGAAAACPTFPANVQTDLSLAYTPPCTVCHTGAVGSLATATQPMAVELIKLGVTPACDPTQLSTALMQMETQKISVDASGTPATTLLQEGCDPNTDQPIGASSIDGGACPGATGDGGTETDVPPMVTFGCGATVPSGCAATIARGPASWPGAAIAAIAGLALARRRRRPRR
jgi:MYXO-CTERM domain-containing protein